MEVLVLSALFAQLSCKGTQITWILLIVISIALRRRWQVFARIRPPRIWWIASTTGTTCNSSCHLNWHNQKVKQHGRTSLRLDAKVAKRLQTQTSSEPTFLATFSEPTGAQKNSRKNAGDKLLKKLRWSKSPPPKRRFEQPGLVNVFAGQDGWIHCLDCSLAAGQLDDMCFWFTCQKPVSGLCSDTCDCIPSQTISTSDLNYLSFLGWSQFNFDHFANWFSIGTTSVLKFIIKKLVRHSGPTAATAAVSTAAGKDATAAGTAQGAGSNRAASPTAAAGLFRPLGLTTGWDGSFAKALGNSDSSSIPSSKMATRKPAAPGRKCTAGSFLPFFVMGTTVRLPRSV